MLSFAYAGVSFKHFMLCLWIYNLLSVLEGRKHFTNVTVGVFSDRRTYRETFVLENYGAQIHDYRSTSSSSLAKVSLQIKTILLRGLSFEEISRTFCSNILESNVTVIILHTRNKKVERLVGHLASYFKVPVIGSITHAPLLSDKVRKESNNTNLHFKCFRCPGSNNKLCCCITCLGLEETRRYVSWQHMPPQNIEAFF